MAQNNDTKFFENLLLQFLGEQDPLLEMLRWITQKLMEIEAGMKAGAPKGKHSRKRKTYFSGTRVRRFDTRLGTVYLLIPKLRKGGYVPFFITEKKRSEQALIEVVQEAFINGVSTRKIERLAHSLGIENISASQVSEINRELDEMVDEFRSRELSNEYPVLWIDALYENIRDGKRVKKMAVMVVQGVNLNGQKEIVAVEPMEQEAEETYRALFRSLKQRGLERVWLCVSDAHRGLQTAIRKELLGCSWQRCKIHFMRNILSVVPAKEKQKFGGRLKQIWKQPDYESARQYAEMIINEYEEQLPKAIARLEEGLEESLQFYHFPEFDVRKISSTNTLERLHEEIRRRTKVVGIFPSSDSYVRLVTCYLIEYSEEWITGRSYISSEAIQVQRAALEKAA
jgi:transposase-like protein